MMDVPKNPLEPETRMRMRKVSSLTTLRRARLSGQMDFPAGKTRRWFSDIARIPKKPCVDKRRWPLACLVILRVDGIPRRQCYDQLMPSLNFKGKALVQNFHLLVPYHELKLVKSKSLTPKPSLHDNLVVHGDNLKALKSLLPYYAGKVKCIYIDPPYNTGNENWVYNDNVSSPMIQEWLGKVVDREDLTRHDKWLCMMWPRLRF